jgi:xanthine/uracil permease
MGLAQKSVTLGLGFRVLVYLSISFNCIGMMIEKINSCFVIESCDYSFM